METITSRPDLLAVADLIQPGEKVLDLGCGDGMLLYYLQEHKDVTAEGVETGKQHSELRRMGCDQMQGFLFSIPLPLHDFEALPGVVEADERAVAS